MAVKTTLEQLEEVQAAITKVMSGQAGSWNGKAVTYADLDALTRRESMLLTRYRQEQGIGGLKINNGIVNREYI